MFTVRLAMIVLLALVGLSGRADAQSVGDQAAALARAGDVDGAAALVRQVYESNPNALGTVLRQVASANPSVAGAVLNVTVRSVGRSTGASDLQSIVQTAVAATLDGVASSNAGSGPDDGPTQSELAENIAVNVRQAIVVVAGGDEGTQNTLLAAARSGVQSSELAQTAAATSTDQNVAATDEDDESVEAADEALNALTGQLVGILNTRLSSTIDDDEAQVLTSTANTGTDPAPIVITRSTTPVVNTPVVTTPVVTTPVVRPIVTITNATIVTPTFTNENRNNVSPF